MIQDPNPVIQFDYLSHNRVWEVCQTLDPIELEKRRDVADHMGLTQADHHDDHDHDLLVLQW